MQKRKLMAIPMLLVFALVLSGFAYAHWSKIITIDGTVTTGRLHLEVISVASDDPPGNKEWNELKDVGCTTAKIGADKQSIIVTITNGYPCYGVYVHFSVHNDGTIPAKLYEIVVDAPPEITVEGWDSLGEQIDPCKNADNTIRVHIEQTAEPETSYTFTVKFIYWNWNEVP